VPVSIHPGYGNSCFYSPFPDIKDIIKIIYIQTLQIMPVSWAEARKRNHKIIVQASNWQNQLEHHRHFNSESSCLSLKFLNFYQKEAYYKSNVIRYPFGNVKTIYIYSYWQESKKQTWENYKLKVFCRFNTATTKKAKFLTTKSSHKTSSSRL
jgi:hypothetical protein